MLHSLVGCTTKPEKDLSSVFRFTVVAYPENYDPLNNRSSFNSYSLSALYSPLLHYQGEKLDSGLAKSCSFTDPLTIHCQLGSHQFSDGQPILAKHYIATFHEMFRRKSTRTENFLNLFNAKKVLAGAPVETLGVQELSDFQLQFKLENPESDFIYRLIDPALTPRLQSDLDGHITTGPYVLVQAKSNRISLQPNPYFDEHAKERPKIEILLVENDITAQNLFSAGQINFLRRITVDAISSYESHPGFFQVPLSRMDYIGLNARKLDLETRKKLIASPNYEDLQKLLHAKGRPGCPSLAPRYFDQYPCIQSPTKTFSNTEVKNKTTPILGFSLTGGDDIARAMEWFQAQWKTQLGLKIELKSFEQGLYTQLLKKDPPELFRRGYPLDRPTCVAALEDFTQNSSENFVKNSDADFEKYFLLLKTTQDIQKQKLYCQKAFERMLAQALIIPLGEIHYSMVSDQKFDGFLINSLNQIDFRDLRPHKK